MEPVEHLHPEDSVRKLDAYYTPVGVARALTKWAITSAKDKVFDPSFGGGAFLHAAVDTLRELGCSEPERQVYGVDIDPGAIREARPLVQQGASRAQFVQADFFDVSVGDMAESPFDVVVGNPPYVRHHDIPLEALEKAKSRLVEFDLSVGGRASYWAYFLLYAIQYLREGGRLAMILPEAVLHARYSEGVRDTLLRSFSSVNIILLEERIFLGTDERSVLVCASGAHQPHTSLQIATADEANDIGRVLHGLAKHAGQVLNSQADGGWLRAVLSGDVVDAYDAIVAGSLVRRLGDLVSIRIGTVTGDNRFFILSRAKQKALAIPERYLQPVVRRSRDLIGLWVTDEELAERAGGDNQFLLLAVDKLTDKLPVELRSYLLQGEKQGVHKRRKCRDRSPWYRVPNVSSPPAFFPIMSASWPRLVINRSAYTCTNNITKVFFRESSVLRNWEPLALGSLSTLSQISAELVGRSYGGGVLKLEPMEMARLAMPIIPDDLARKWAPIIDRLLRSSGTSEATELVDSLLLDLGVYPSEKELEDLRRGRDRLHLRRRGRRNGRVKG